MKTRLFALLVLVLSAGMTYLNWHQLQTKGRYSMKGAVLMPLGIVVGSFMFVFPSLAGKPSTTKERVLALLMIVTGLGASLLNWYLMDPGFFGF